ncbi:MAG: hypothetical protein P4L99_25015 [Chthoniobacter sp.]|nr:hypothetical protein [Chthoniobacter sp.]
MLFPIVIVGAILGFIFYVVGRFIKGRSLQIIGAILGVMFLLYVLRTAHIVNI